MKLETERLYLRSLTDADAEAFYNIKGDKALNKYQGWIPDSVADVQTFIEKSKGIKFNESNTWYQLLAVVKSSKTIIGGVAIHFLEEETKCELGVVISTPFHKMGYASEAMEAVIQTLFDNYAKEVILASIDPRNIASIRMVEKQRFVKIAHHKKAFLLRGEFVDDVIYKLRKEDWVR